MKSGFLQPKLRNGQPKDLYEAEAYRIAKIGMRMPEGKGEVYIQRQVSAEPVPTEINKSEGGAPETSPVDGGYCTR
jgi:hypothetical protein